MSPCLTSGTVLSSTACGVPNIKILHTSNFPWWECCCGWAPGCGLRGRAGPLTALGESGFETFLLRLHFYLESKQWDKNQCAHLPILLQPLHSWLFVLLFFLICPYGGINPIMKGLQLNRLLNLTNSLIGVQLLLRQQVIFYSLLHKYDEPVRLHSARIVLSTLATPWFYIIKIFYYHILKFKVVQNILSCLTFFYCDKDQSEKQLGEGAVCLTLQPPVMTGGQGRSSRLILEAETEGAISECCLLARYSWLCFLSYTAHNRLPRGGVSYNGCTCSSLCVSLILTQAQDIPHWLALDYKL